VLCRVQGQIGDVAERADLPVQQAPHRIRECDILRAMYETL
jgi:hypothetical protein